MVVSSLGLFVAFYFLRVELSIVSALCMVDLTVLG